MYENRAPREEFDVTCAECGKATTVPFKPSGTRPVLCRDCFAKNRPAGGSGPRSFGDRPPPPEGAPHAWQTPPPPAAAPPRGSGAPPPRRDFGGPGGDRGERQMFDTTCTRCGTATQVPFKPTPGRGVYRRDCFRSVTPR